MDILYGDLIEECKMRHYYISGGMNILNEANMGVSFNLDKRYTYL